MAKQHIHRVARTFEEVFNNADQFSTPTKHHIKAYGNTPPPGRMRKKNGKILYLRTSPEAKSPYTTRPLGGVRRVESFADGVERAAEVVANVCHDF